MLVVMLACRYGEAIREERQAMEAVMEHRRKMAEWYANNKANDNAPSRKQVCVRVCVCACVRDGGEGGGYAYTSVSSLCVFVRACLCF